MHDVPYTVGRNKISLKPHQRKVINTILNGGTHGILVKHGLGTGKTITSIACFEALNEIHDGQLVALAVVPAKLINNYRKELEFVGVDKQRYEVTSYEMFAKMYTGRSSYSNAVLVLDEAHVLRTSSTAKTQAIVSASSSCKKVIALSGTPMVNFPSDISVLVNICAGREVLPLTWSAFKMRYYDVEFENPLLSFPFDFRVKGVHVRNKRELVDKCRNLISCVETPQENFPAAYFFTKRVPMSSEQYTVYQSMESEFLTPEARRIMNKSDTDSGNVQLNSFMNKTRSVSNTIPGSDAFVNPEKSPKMVEILHEIQDSNIFPVVVYSFFRATGVEPMRNLCEKAGLLCNEITGDTTKGDVGEIVREYNQGNTDVLLLSGAAGYGLDLKRTRQIHIMEPAWNKAKIDQVIGRGIRYKSHETLPTEEQRVDVYYWLSVIPRGFFDIFGTRPSADEYLIEKSKKKDTVLNLFYDVICDASIEKMGEMIPYADSKPQRRTKGRFSAHKIERGLRVT